MSVFIVVPGFFTDAETWAEPARRLTEALPGAEVRVVGLPGADATAGGVTLDAHIERVVDAVDAAGVPTERDVVLVGHDYGVFPAQGAADRRAERIARIVYIDSPIPADGTPALAAVPDQSLRASLFAQGAEHSAEAADGVPVPAPGQWQYWGSTRDLSDAALERLGAAAAPHPVATLTEPLKLSGAAAGIPTTGILCHYNGASIETVRMRIRFGDPMLAALVRPDVTFFELPTGHWPMLTHPDLLARTLIAAAAGEGERLDAPPADPETAARAAEAPGTFLLDVPPLPRERHGSLDLYLPEGGENATGLPLPAVLFIHGGPVPKGVEPTPRDWPALTGYARHAASLGVVGATVDHRLHDVTDYPVAAADLADAVQALRDDPRVDGDRIALWFLSGSGPLTAEWLDGPPSWLRCLVACYPIMAPMPNWGVPAGRFRPAEVVGEAGSLPVVVLRPELEQPVFADTVDRFLRAADDTEEAVVEVIGIPGARHGFEGLDHTEAARDAVRRAVAYVLDRLGAPGGA
ncbi:alpha/beta fold hydrolase [Streptomyces sp. NPDC050145]|uniref:alpha/beta hydrolase n=1 Tax=Streptomyces sp. NPDC050145 TaxID=3365602 RepID=UPI00378C5565